MFFLCVETLTLFPVDLASVYFWPRYQEVSNTIESGKAELDCIAQLQLTGLCNDIDCTPTAMLATLLSSSLSFETSKLLHGLTTDMSVTTVG